MRGLSLQCNTSASCLNLLLHLHLSAIACAATQALHTGVSQHCPATHRDMAAKGPVAVQWSWLVGRLHLSLHVISHEQQVTM
jgi:hypothetical protein